MKISRIVKSGRFNKSTWETVESSSLSIFSIGWLIFPLELMISTSPPKCVMLWDSEILFLTLPVISTVTLVKYSNFCFIYIIFFFVMLWLWKTNVPYESKVLLLLGILTALDQMVWRIGKSEINSASLSSVAAKNNLSNSFSNSVTNLGCT